MRGEPPARAVPDSRGHALARSADRSPTARATVARRPRQSEEDAEPLEAAVIQVLRATGPGDLLSYGQLARLAGRPGAGRAVGRVLAASSGLPWWRVVTASGRLVPGLEQRQAGLLAKEGLRCRGRHVVGRSRAGSPPAGTPGPDRGGC
ncbi:MAG: MGMT family protein [Candidatus Dormibacteria bacterium]